MTERNDKARERRLHNRLMRKIYKLCRSGEWHLRLDKLLGGGKACVDLGLVDDTGTPNVNVQGTVDYETQTIGVDFRVDVMSTFVHECLHVIGSHRFGPDEDAGEESWVCEHERLVMRHMTPVQARRLFSLMAKMTRRG